MPAPGRGAPNDAECPAPRINTESDLPARRTDDGGILPFLAVVVYALAHTRGAGQEDRASGGDRVPDEPERFGVPDDIIGALSDRVSELTQRVATLESELDVARKRVAIYEEFDSTLREGLAGALRSAHQIRSRAEHASQQILVQARDERKMLLKEIERLRDERDGLADEIASTRRSGISALRGPRRELAAAPQERSNEQSAAELRSMATEALRGVFTELLDDIRQEVRSAADIAREASLAAEQVRAGQDQARAAQEQALEELRRAQEELRSTAEAQRGAEQERLEAASRAAEGLARAEAEARAERAAAAAARPERIGAEAARPERIAEPAVPRFGVVGRDEIAARIGLDEIAVRRDAAVTRPGEEPETPTRNIVLMLSPIPSFARLVEIERRIQSLKQVRTLYVRDLKGGVASLVLGLRAPMLVDEMGAAIASLTQPRLAVQRTGAETLELRIEGEAGVA